MADKRRPKKRKDVSTFLRYSCWVFDFACSKLEWLITWIPKTRQSTGRAEALKPAFCVSYGGESFADFLLCLVRFAEVWLMLSLFKHSAMLRKVRFGNLPTIACDCYFVMRFFHPTPLSDWVEFFPTGDQNQRRDITEQQAEKNIIIGARSRVLRCCSHQCRVGRRVDECYVQCCHHVT